MTQNELTTKAKLVSNHSLDAISSVNNQVAQFDNIHTYNECAIAAHQTSRFLESEGFSSVAVPALSQLIWKNLNMS